MIRIFNQHPETNQDKLAVKFANGDKKVLKVLWCVLASSDR